MREIPLNSIKQIFDYNPKLAVKDKLFTPLSKVKLNRGLFADVFYNNRIFLTKLDIGAMKYWFDIKTGTPTDAEPYRGHFEDNLKGSVLSEFVMGACNALRWTDDEELEKRLDVLLERLFSSAEDDGFIMPVDKRNFAHREYPHYVRIWLTYALCAAGLSYTPKAYEVLRKWQDWFNSCPDLPIIKYLELAFQGIVASTYVYTTPVGKTEDIDTAVSAYEEPWRLAQFMRRERGCVHIRRQPGKEPHAHGSELEGIEGYLDLYRATGRSYYLDAVLGAWELYRADWQHAGGGIVMCEGMPDNYPGCAWLDSKNHYNELCCSSFWIFLNLRLHRLFPDEEEYVSEIEKSLYNIAIANQDGGDGIRYFAYLEGEKQQSGLVHCCCGVGTRIFGSLPEFIYSVSEDAVSVDLYAASEIEWVRKSGNVKINMQTEFPYSDDVRITVDTKSPADFQLRLRIPNWCAREVSVSLNGSIIAKCSAGCYLPVTRTWNCGDVIEFTLKQEFRLTKYTGADELDGFDRYYIEHGPVLFAVCGDSVKRALMVGWSTDDFENYLIKTDKKLNFGIKMHDSLSLVPYFEIPSGVSMTCCPIFVQ